MLVHLSTPRGTGPKAGGQCKRSKVHTNLACVKIEVLDNVCLQSLHRTGARLLRCVDERGVSIIEVLCEGRHPSLHIVFETFRQVLMLVLHRYDDYVISCCQGSVSIGIRTRYMRTSYLPVEREEDAAHESKALQCGHQLCLTFGTAG